MPFTWKDLHALSLEWNTSIERSSYPDATYRSIISRTYYAVYHAAFALSREIGFPSTHSASDHYRLRKFLNHVAVLLSPSINHSPPSMIYASPPTTKSTTITPSAKTQSKLLKKLLPLQQQPFSKLNGSNRIDKQKEAATPMWRSSLFALVTARI